MIIFRKSDLVNIQIILRSNQQLVQPTTTAPAASIGATYWKYWEELTISWSARYNKQELMLQ